MTKPDWKKKFHEPHLTDAQKVKVLEKQVLEIAAERDKYHEVARHYKKEFDHARLDAARFDALRRKEVMVFDGEPKYLVRDTLDEYCDTIKDDFYGMSLPDRIYHMGRRGNAFAAQPTKLMVPPAIQQQTQQMIKDYYGNDARGKSKEADQKDSGHHTDILRYADWDRLWKQRST